MKAHLKKTVRRAWFLAVFAWTSCTSFSGYLSSPEGPFLPRPYSIAFQANTIQDLEAPFIPLVPGITYTRFTIQNPPLESWAVMVDLSHPHVEIVVGPPVEYPGVGRSITVRHFAEKTNSLVAINATPFEPVSDREGEIRQHRGLGINQYEILSFPHPRYSALIITKEKNAIIMDQSLFVQAPHLLSEVSYGIGGFFTILKEGSILSYKEIRSPRSAIGVLADKKHIILLVIDGRRQSSVGATAGETAEILRRLGAQDGLLLDGGGSTTLVVQRPGETSAQILNIPIHSTIPRKERAVGLCLGVRYREPTEGSPLSGLLSQ
ncbi:MAG: phosphodiester glycosidase family protein [Treponemataceae bacterium]|nr:phosphodiester glycosidase family protein [Treponemataceae bacterium]